MMDYLMFDEDELETPEKETIARPENMTDDEVETAAAEWGLF